MGRQLLTLVVQAQRTGVISDSRTLLEQRAVRSPNYRRLSVLTLITVLLVACGEEEQDSVLPAPTSVTAPGVVHLCTPDEFMSEGFMTYRAALEERRCVRDLFAWPANYFPLIRESTDSRVATGGFEVGYGYTTMTTAWECAWMGAWLDSRATGDQALTDQIANYITTQFPVYHEHIPGMPDDIMDGSVIELNKITARSVALGDAADVRERFGPQCQNLEWTTAPAELVPTMPLTRTDTSTGTP